MLRWIAPLLAVWMLSGVTDSAAHGFTPLQRSPAATTGSTSVLPAVRILGSAATARIPAELPIPPTQAVAGLTQGLEARARRTSRDLDDILAEIFSVPAAHAAEIEEGPEMPEAPGALKRLWDSVKDKPLIRRVRTVASWVAAAARFLWAIPKALIQGDSDGLIEALGGILAQASADDTGVRNPDSAPPLLAPEAAVRSAIATGDPDSAHTVERSGP